MLEQMSGTTNHRIGKLYGSGRGCRRYSRTLLYGLALGACRSMEVITDDAGGNMACRRYGERHQEGVQQGIKEGKHQAPVQVAEAMRNRGIDDQAIMEMTGLSEDELQRLRH